MLHSIVGLILYFTTMFVTKEFTFQASHFLTNYHGTCERLHGHSYRLAVTVEGSVGEDDLVIDFSVLKDIVGRNVLEKLDHNHLNDLFENPSAERVCEWIWAQIEKALELLQGEVTLYEVRLWETEGSSVMMRARTK